MSNSGGGGRTGRGSGGGGSGGGSGRVMIPETVRKTILSIRETTGRQHSDEDIYSVLKDCAMDPNETAQKLLYLDTFHEVKSKRDRRKEISSTQSRGARGGRGNNYANHIHPDTMGRKIAAPRRENGVNHTKEKGYPPSFPVMQNTISNPVIKETKASAVMPNGSLTLPNGGSTLGRGPQSPTKEAVNITIDSSVIDAKKPGKTSIFPTVPLSPLNQTSECVVQVQQGKTAPILNHLPTPKSASVSGVNSSTSDPVLAPSMAWHTGTMAAIKREVGSRQGDAGHNYLQGYKPVSPDVSPKLLKNEKAGSTIAPSGKPEKVSSKMQSTEKNELSRTLQPPLSTDDSSLAVRPGSSDNHASQDSVLPLAVVSSEESQAEDSSLMSSEQSVPNGHVIFPNHFKVPEALKSGLSFGSFETNSGVGSNGNDNSYDVNSADSVELSHGTDETAREASLSQSASSIVQVDYPDQPESPQEVCDESGKSDGHVAPNVDTNSDKPIQETMPILEGHHNPAVHFPPNYGFGFIPHMQGGHYVHYEGHEIQSENPTASSGPSPSLSPTPAQNSIAASPHPLLFRPPYPPSYFPYGYFNPYFLPAMHQFLSHNGIAQQPSTGNPYLTQAAPTPGVKFPLPQFKPGTSNGNSTPIGIQGLYGSYGTSPIGFNPGPAVTAGSAVSNEDLTASQLKENQIYTTGALNDVSAWISPPGPDMSNLHLNPMYHLTPQGQHLAFSHVQPGHSPYPGIYPQMQTMGAPPTVMQQSQPMSVTAETVGPPSGAYQQAQLAQMNWNSSY
ncbi:GBF-interacting protein 1-like isoform X2 [Mercurialis annua]|uniref:GBF-interacting protein 1-like isoform X2 n=1 Tax=Mercurialis annua TaxID=3986 RepID=UPI00215E81F5|nr:GBF-interacting protein 1-like isoform X2 [Mercurialis annua]